MYIKVTYRKNTNFSKEEKEFIHNTAKKYGEVRIDEYSSRFGAIDLITFIEFSIYYIVLVNLKAFIKGFIGEDWFKSIGKQSRLSIGKELNNIRLFLIDYYNCFVLNKPDVNEAFTITEDIGDTRLYVVINHSRMTQKLIERLPEAIVEIYGRISLELIIVEGKTCQLYPDFEKEEWRYLFIPTYQGFGNFVDKYFDLELNKELILKTKTEFIDKFQISIEDECKLIINPYRY